MLHARSRPVTYPSHILRRLTSRAAVPGCRKATFRQPGCRKVAFQSRTAQPSHDFSRTPTAGSSDCIARSGREFDRTSPHTSVYGTHSRPASQQCATSSLRAVPERTVYQRCLEGGPWQRVLPGIVLLFTGHPTVDQLVHAALLLCGPDAMVTGVEACRRHGLRRGPARRGDTERSKIHVLVPASRQVRSVEFVHVERTCRLPAPVLRDGIPLAPLVRACTDAARRIRSAAEVTELFVRRCAAQACARLPRCGRSSAQARGEAPPFPAPSLLTLRRSAVSGGALRQAVVAEHGAARTVVERRGVRRPRAQSWVSRTAGSTRSRWYGRSSRASGT